MKKKLFLSFLILMFSVSLIAQQTPNAKVKSANAEYLQIILYGQSLGLGWQCPQAITTTAIDGNYMIGNNVNILYGNDTKVLTPLGATKWKSGGEQPIVSCLNAFSYEYKNAINQNQKFIAMTAGEGGQTIERLSKECTNAGYYTSTFEKVLDNTLVAINGKTVACPAILYMQGEYNSTASGTVGKGMTPGTNGTTNKDVYKSLLMTLKNNMQADIMAKYNQAKKPLFFIYQTSGKYVNTKEMPIVMAQIEFANENDDVVLLNPHYAMPDYTAGHLSTNGYRWFGEYMAKALSDVLVYGKTYKTLKTSNIEIKDQKVKIDYVVPVVPLTFDTLTTPKVANYGFCVYKDGVSQTIKSINIVNGNTVEINCNAKLSGKIEIVYAGSTTNGSGNLRDNDGYKSMYTYYDDSAASLQETYTPQVVNGTIYGQHYGLQNWADQFYYTANVSASTGLSSNKMNNKAAYPNPAKNHINFEVDVDVKDPVLSIYDSVGKSICIQSFEPRDIAYRLNTNSFENGLYYYNIASLGVTIQKSYFMVKK